MKNLKRSWAEPYKIKMVELLKMTTPIQRKKALKEAGYNTFLLRSDDVYIDLLTDSGTSAMSDRQWAGMMMGDEAYAGSRNFYHLEEVAREVYGYKYLIPTHQGRGAENILSKILIKKGDIIPGNMYFTTTRLHQELAGGKFEDIIIDEAHDPENEFPFKGNVDLDKLDKLVKKQGANKIPYVSIATSVNMAGGQPISMKNLKELRAFTKKHKILIIHDMTRVAENAYFIQQKEKGFDKKSVREIVKEICSYTDGATMSAKKEEAEYWKNTGMKKVGKIEFEKIIKVALIDINTVVKKYCKKIPDFISLDVEGLDMAILQSFDFNLLSPKVFIVETLKYDSEQKEYKNKEIIDFMEQKGYEIYADTHINTIFIIP